MTTAIKTRLTESYQELADQVAEYLEGRGYASNGTSVTVRAGRDGEYEANLTIFTTDADGDEVELNLRRTFDMQTGRVRHDSFEIPRDHQNLGLSSVFTQHAVDLYDELGVTDISLKANLEVGGYVWARYGFVPDPSVIREWYTTWGLAEASLDDMDITLHFLENLQSYKQRLLGSSWEGELDLSDPVQRDMFEEYLFRQASKSRAYKQIHPGRVEETRRARKNLARSPSLAMTDEMRIAITRHQIELLRYADGVRTRMVDLIDRSEADIAQQLARRLPAIAGRDLAGETTQRRLQELLDGLQETRRGATDEAFAQIRRELQALAEGEAEWTADQLELVAPVVLDTIMPDPGLLRSLVENEPFQGRLLSEWAEDVALGDIQRITDQLRIGMLSGENVEQLSRRIMGSVALRGGDGVLEITRRNATSIARTAVMHFAAAARAEVYDSNRDIIDKERYLATLDSRTTLLCRSLDGNDYDVGDGPHPPQHFQCRSIRIPIFNGQAIGNRPMKATTDQQILREYAASEGLDRVPRSRDDLPRGHKTRYDRFARQRIADATSVVDANVTYEDFLRRQPVWFQEDVLGRDRARLFREGGLTLDKFVDASGRQYTLDELRATQAETFRRVFGGDGGRRSARQGSPRVARQERTRTMIDEARASGHEQSLIIDADTGRTLSSRTDDLKDRVEFRLDQVRGRSVELHHTHPTTTSFSVEDLMVAQSAVSNYGATAVSMWAHSADGDHYKVRVLKSLTEADRQRWYLASYRAIQELTRALPDLDPQEARLLAPHFAMLAMKRLGTARYSYSLGARQQRIMKRLGTARAREVVDAAMQEMR